MVDAVFGAEGALARALPGYEVRAGQLEMARAVEEAIARKRHLAVEAPCGIGKTFAYLVPAIRHALATDSRVIVCTANIALQEQIVSKDLPALQSLLGTPFSYALIKGINNYFCRDRYEEASREIPTLTFDREELHDFRRIGAWSQETRSGDLSDLDFEPRDGVWARVNGVSELCNGAQCRFYEDCFAMEARRRVRAAQVVVTNYHLFFA
ncbi:MAG TPA: DEAD/DEAH box helicase, partial [Planctomycetota bacterium]|nr:DEAD/DEAH box helicase [Planctomycetota bacterium]